MDGPNDMDKIEESKHAEWNVPTDKPHPFYQEDPEEFEEKGANMGESISRDVAADIVYEFIEGVGVDRGTLMQAVEMHLDDLKDSIMEKDEKIRTLEKAIADLEAENMTLKRDKDRLAEESDIWHERYKIVYEIHMDVMERMMEKL